MPGEASLPGDFVLVRTTPEFTDATVPAGLRSRHRVASGVWGRLCVRDGTVRLVFEDSGVAADVTAGGHSDIPPGHAHHVEPAPGSSFVVEFYGPPPGSGE